MNDDAQKAAKAAIEKHNGTEAEKPSETIREFLELNAGKLTEALGKSIPVDYFISAAIGSVRATPALGECDRVSLVSELFKAAQMRLLVGVTDEAYLVPFKKHGKPQAKLVIGYKGLLKLARNSGLLKSVQAHAVYSNDEFEFEYGIEEKLRHVPAKGERGDLVFFYAYALFKDGGSAFEVMTVADVNKVRDGSPGSGREDSAWRTNYVAMGRKTVFRRLTNFLPRSVFPAWAQEAISAENELNPDLEIATIDPAFEPAGPDPAPALPGSTGVTEPSPAKRGPGRPPKEKADPMPSEEIKAPQSEPEAPKTATPPAPANPPVVPPDMQTGANYEELKKKALGNAGIKIEAGLQPGETVDMFTGEVTKTPEASKPQPKKVSIPGFDD